MRAGSSAGARQPNETDEIARTMRVVRTYLK
jgi:FrmR/RcnR family transcriptional regulator, repressor of frmRAB operon